jgi:hypothetical protein
VRCTVSSDSRRAVKLRYVDLVVSNEGDFEACCCFTVLRCKQRLKRHTDKVCNFLIQFLLTVVFLIEELVFINARRLSERTILARNAV